MNKGFTFYLSSVIITWRQYLIICMYLVLHPLSLPIIFKGLPATPPCPFPVSRCAIESLIIKYLIKSIGPPKKKNESNYFIPRFGREPIAILVWAYRLQRHGRRATLVNRKKCVSQDFSLLQHLLRFFADQRKAAAAGGREGYLIHFAPFQ